LIRNYFADLELDHEATIKEVREAFKRLAKKFHPDVNHNDPVAEESFKRIQEAYSHLNTGTKIVRLKNRLSMIRELENSSITKWKDAKKEEAVEPISENRTSRSRTKRAENLDLHLSLTVSERVLLSGGRERFQFVYEKPCENCKGRGGTSRSVATTCKKCAGLGTYLISRGNLKWKKTCEDCYGKGSIVLLPCSACSGKGKISEHQAVEIQVPSGVDLNQEVCLKNLGHISFDGTKRGNLWLTLQRRDEP